jgi:hypothetical protein
MSFPLAPGPAEARLAREIQELAQLQARTGGKFVLEIVPEGPLRLHITCRSPLRQAGGEVTIETAEHEIDLILPRSWPAEPPVLLHRRPAGVVHPNILSDVQTTTRSRPAVIRALAQGYVCYGHQASPSTHLTAIVEQLYNMLGFRHGAYSHSLADCLSPTAVQWVNRTLSHSPGELPTERHPFIVRQEGRT